MSIEARPRVTINLVVLNGEKYIRYCLGTVKNQVYQNIEVNICDNGSTDNTKKIVKDEFPQFNLIEFDKNYSMWGGQEKALEFSNGKYIMALSVDVLLESKVIEEAIKIFGGDDKIGAIQPKIYQFKLLGGKISKTNIIDTCGFQIFRSRRVINIGHGESSVAKAMEDKERTGDPIEIFAVEGAAPIFKREALNDCKIYGEIVDHDMFWYGDDIDLCWRMNLFGWKQIYSPKIVAHHDRQTTHTLRKSKKEFIKIRKKIPTLKRRLDYRNSRLMLVKNDYLINLAKDLPYFLKREIPLWGYFLLYEPFMFLEIPTMIELLPRMLKKRKEIMKKAKISPREIHRWFK